VPAQFHPEHYAALHGYTNMFMDSLEGESKNLQSLPATVGPKPEDWMSSRLSALYLKVSLLRIHLPRFDYVVWMVWMYGWIWMFTSLTWNGHSVPSQV
jgi:hypothetical protein